MSDEVKPNGKFDWRAVLVSAAIVVGGWLVQWGVTSSTLADHSRRLDMIEKRQEDNYLSRTEYERRHEDLQRVVEEDHRELRELERKIK